MSDGKKMEEHADEMLNASGVVMPASATNAWFAFWTLPLIVTAHMVRLSR